MIEFVRMFLNNDYLFGALCFLLTMGPFIGIMIIHLEEDR